VSRFRQIATCGARDRVRLGLKHTRGRGDRRRRDFLADSRQAKALLQLLIKDLRVATKHLPTRAVSSSEASSRLGLTGSSQSLRTTRSRSDDMGTADRRGEHLRFMVGLAR
jgi:hypothetical protein